MTSKIATAADIIADLQDCITQLKACTDDSYILAYKNGLGIRFIEPGKPVVCALWVADAIMTQEQARKMPEEAWAFTPIVKNGANEQAELITRQAAIAREIKSVEEHIAYFSA